MQMSLVHETINDALREVIQAAGGFKAVGHLLWRDLPVDHAASRLRDCLNADRREHLTPSQVALLLRLGREVGCHAAAVFLMRDAGYSDPVPVEPEDEKARLQREFIEATKTLNRMAERIAALDAAPKMRSVA